MPPSAQKNEHRFQCGQRCSVSTDMSMTPIYRWNSSWRIIRAICSRYVTCKCMQPKNALKNAQISRRPDRSGTTGHITPPAMPSTFDSSPMHRSPPRSSSPHCHLWICLEHSHGCQWMRVRRSSWRWAHATRIPHSCHIPPTSHGHYTAEAVAPPWGQQEARKPSHSSHAPKSNLAACCVMDLYSNSSHRRLGRHVRGGGYEGRYGSAHGGDGDHGCVHCCRSHMRIGGLRSFHGNLGSFHSRRCSSKSCSLVALRQGKGSHTHHTPTSTFLVVFEEMGQGSKVLVSSYSFLTHSYHFLVSNCDWCVFFSNVTMMNPQFQGFHTQHTTISTFLMVFFTSQIGPGG